MDNLFITPINMMQGISGIDNVLGGSQAQDNSQKVSGQNGVSLFQSVFEDAIKNVWEQEQDYARKEYLLATGQIDDPHTVPIAGAEVQLSIDMLVQIRNKALEAYNSLITMSL